jgi:molybdopterin synthase catalytic subunit/molybdopterin synthase sulfur carrier subunit
MKVELKLFAVARQLGGCDTISIDLPAGATVAALRAALAEQTPALAPILPRVMFAVNADYAVDETVIAAGAEVACIPPVSGG